MQGVQDITGHGSYGPSACGQVKRLSRMGITPLMAVRWLLLLC